MTPQGRWERLASVTFWLGWLFVAIAGYGIFEGDDLGGVVMTLAPGLLCFAMWGFAARRRDA